MSSGSFVSRKIFLSIFLILLGLGFISGGKGFVVPIIGGMLLIALPSWIDFPANRHVSFKRSLLILVWSCFLWMGLCTLWSPNVPFALQSYIGVLGIVLMSLAIGHSYKTWTVDDHHFFARGFVWMYLVALLWMLGLYGHIAFKADWSRANRYLRSMPALVQFFPLCMAYLWGSTLLYRWQMAFGLGILMCCANYLYPIDVGVHMIWVMGLTAAILYRWPNLIHRFWAFLAACLLLTPVIPKTVLSPKLWLPLFPYIDLSWQHRFFMWEHLSNYIASHWLLGVGFHGLRNIHDSTAPLFVHADGTLEVGGVELVTSHPHNAFLQIWLELGVAGVLLCLFLLYFGLRPGLERLSSRSSKVLMGTHLVGMCFWGAISYGLWQSWFLSVLCLSTVLLYNVLQYKDNRKNVMGR